MKDFVMDRQVELEVNLDPGSYIIVPRTTGCVCLRSTTPDYDDPIRFPLFVPFIEDPKSLQSTLSVMTI